MGGWDIARRPAEKTDVSSVSVRAQYALGGGTVTATGSRTDKTRPHAAA